MMMFERGNIISRLTLLLPLVILLYGCSTERPAGKTEAEVLYREAVNLSDDGRNLIAIERLNLIKSKYPYSYYATHAELLHADILFKQENYLEAVAAYIMFKDFHPKHEKISYVVWKIAEAYYHQLPSTHDRDLSVAEQAIKYYNQLLVHYPKSEHGEQGRKRVEECWQMLRAQEKYIADFYYKTKVYDAAIYRYRLIIDNYKTGPEVQHAAARIIRSAHQLKSMEQCIEYYTKYQTLLAKEARGEVLDLMRECRKFPPIVKDKGQG
ncbi:MAG: outer membrane protein assembly factor BamD [Bdellovibrionales bacterium]|nr:outer membrane protein assembly factor BamD [Bdellovibrionales bacterium]